jgi:hypothetical protein
VLVVKLGDDQKYGFSLCACRNFQERWITPELLSRDKVNAMLPKVGGTFGGIKGKLHGG